MKPSTPIVPSTVRNRERDKALVIALAYKRMREVPVSPIPTAIDDGLAIYEYLKEQEAYLEKNIVIMTDSCDNPNMTATRLGENIVSSSDLPHHLRWLIILAPGNREFDGGYAGWRSTRFLL